MFFIPSLVLSTPDILYCRRVGCFRVFVFGLHQHDLGDVRLGPVVRERYLFRNLPVRSVPDLSERRLVALNGKSDRCQDEQLSPGAALCGRPG